MNPTRPAGSFPRILLCLLLAGAALAAAGCQTSKGFGQDVEKLGEKIQDKSK